MLYARIKLRGSNARPVSCQAQTRKRTGADGGQSKISRTGSTPSARG
ncbi:hypothetical protein RC1_1905 [Rhodospirillum centenum SW]|uniref:Uncharacterized protein n=1 Tax=Rhodospirillum centenum (strain ATCC 51521 / SW) TaxID=414684 RepID=B6ITK1_RHOCS|nr:hypothetical protein RC1_1905 [Rhodospirillum centenum SW]